MEGGYPGHGPYGRQPTLQGRGGGASGNPNSATGGGAGAGGGMTQQGYENDMRAAARYGMAPPGSMQHHHGIVHPNMDPGMGGGGGMGGIYHRGPHHDGMGGPGGMMAMQQQNFPGYASQELSPNMPRMSAGGMYGMQGQPPQPQQPQRGNSPTSYGNTLVGSGGRGSGGGNDSQNGPGMAEMGSNSERGGVSGPGQPGMPGSMSGPNAAGGTAPTSASQAEREEELLLNLLIARRQRGRISGEQGQSRQEGYYADELLRLRQGRAAAAAAAAGQPGGRGGGNLPPMPGMPPIYMDHPINTLPAVSGHHMNVGIAGHAGGAYNDHHVYKSPSDVVAMNLPIQEGVDQRIDRSPPHLMDARSQDMMMMRDFSGRGMKRNPYDMVAGPPMHQAGMGPMKYHMGMQGFDMTGAGTGGPPAKKKRSHKKKPADMPRRPLSAYNLFFSEERERILKEIDGEKNEEGEDKKDEEKTEEDKTKEEKSSEAASEGGEEDESSKPKALLRPLIPSQKKRRPHRKTHGKISFQQLARMVGERWKALPDERRKKYQELAQEDMKRQKQAMEEYYAKQQALKEGRGGDLYMKQQQQQSMEAHVSEGIPESSNI